LQYISDTVLTDIERQELVRQAALKLGISVTDDEVKEKLESDKLPTNPLEMDIVVAELLWDKMLDEHFEYVVPTSAEQRHVMAMLLESESSAAEIRDRLEEGEDFMELAAEYSLDSQLETYQGNYSWHPEEVLEELLTASSKPVEYAFLPDVVGELSQPLHDEGVYKSLGYWLIEVLERDEEGEQVHVQGILLGNEEEAQEVRAKLEDGADFAEIAVEYSQYPAVESNKGDLRWIAKGDRGSSFDEFAFNPDIELGTLSEPVRDETAYTQGGYWLVKVIDENDDMPITAEDREIMKSKAMNEWADSLFDNPEYVIDEGNLDEEKKAWALERARKELEKAEKASS